MIFGTSVLLSAAFFFCTNRENEPGVMNEIKKACFGDSCFTVELARTQEEHSLGLMFRESLEQDRGMLFVFEENGNYSFWMKNTLIPLDIIWIDENNKVVFVYKKAQPCREDPCPSISPGSEARYVLEINAGAARGAGIAPGDKVNFSY